MKPFYVLKGILLIAILCGLNLPVFAQSVTTFVCPANLTAVYIDMSGAGGGSSGGNNATNSIGGAGGRVQAVVAVTPGVTYFVYTGSAGGTGSTTAGGSAGINYGGGGGGVGALNPGTEGGGGGGASTDIRVGGTTLANRIVVVGGGGGGASTSGIANVDNGGAGGGLTGLNGNLNNVTTGTQVGLGGTSAAGGIGGTAGTPNGFSGGPGVGGAASPASLTGGGGGGGYFGGGGGYSGGGGGGSSFTSPSLVLAFTHTQGYNAGSGSYTLTTGAITSSVSSFSFGNIALGSSSPAQTTTLGGSNLIAATTPTVTVTAPSGFLVSFNGTTWASVITTTYTVPSLAQPLYIEFNPVAYSNYTGNVVVYAGGAFLNIPVTGIGAYPCSGTPAVGIASVTPTAGGATTTMSLAIPAVNGIAGITYQWQYWSFGTGGAPFFTNIGFANTPTFGLSGITGNTYFQCIETCAYTGQSAVSNIVSATFTGGTTCTAATANGTSVNATALTGCSPSYATTMFLENTGGLASSTASNLLYTWTMSTTGPTGVFNVINGATNPYYTNTVTGGNVWIQGQVTCLATSTTFNTPIQTFTLNPVPVVSETSTNICIGTPDQFTSVPSTGTWSSNNTSLTTIGASSGIATGVAPGLTSIVYTLPTGCSTTTTVTVNNGTSAISGTALVCPGTSTSLTDLVSGGSWSSSNTSQATVGTSTGIVTGVAIGTPNIVYTLPDGCFATIPVTVNPNPLPIVGSGTVCVGQPDILSDPTPGGNWSTSNTFQASVGSASGIATGIAAGTPNIWYTLSTGCRATLALHVNANPGAITGNTTVCSGSTTRLTEFGGTWSSLFPTIATVGSSTGTVTGVNAGTTVITFTSTFSGCWVTTPVTVNSLPILSNVTEPGGGGFCPGGSGVHIGLDNSFEDVKYYLYYGSSIVDSLSGASSAIDFGIFGGLGTYSVTAVNVLTGCTDNMTGSANVYNYMLPTLDSVLGGGSFCNGGTGVDVYLPGSDNGVNYQLYIDGSPSGLPYTGTGTLLDLGMKTAPGYYTVVATNVTTTCTDNMPGGASVYVLPTPSIDTLSAGGSYCLNGSGVDVALNNSTLGIFYKLYYNGSLINTIYSTGGPLDFGNQTGGGDYTVVALDNTVHCTSNMYDTAKIIVDSLPVLYSTVGGGNYCYGGSGLHIGLDYGVVGTNYMLYRGSTLVNTVSGSDAGLDFGAQTIPGMYSVVGKFTSTGCLDTMTGRVSIGVDSLPASFNVTGTAGYCTGGLGTPVSLSGSQAGTNFKYELSLGGVNLGTMNGTGGGLAFGMQTAPGVYQVIAKDTITTCTRVMNDSAVVTVYPLPVAYNLTGGGSYCTGSAGLPVNLSYSQSNTQYHLVEGGSTVETMSSTGGVSISFGMQTTAGVYTATAMNTTTGCTNTMNGTVTIGTLPLPAQYGVTGGGTECLGGSGFAVNLAVSNIGIKYQLYNGSSAVGSALIGDGSGLPFGVQNAAGVYKVVATNVSTGCLDTMTGSATIVIHSLPLSFTAGGGGTICAGAPGVDVNLSSSDASGVSYQLYVGSLMEGGAMSGTGHPIDFGPQNAGGSYYVVASNSFGCTDTMAGRPLVVVNPAPTIYNVSGGGSFCANDTGLHIFLNGSGTFVNYMVYRAGSIPVGGFWAGTGLPLDLGLDSVAGVYTVVAKDDHTGCTSNMTGSATLVVNPVVTPSVAVSYTGMGTGVCAGSTTTFTATPASGGAGPMYQWMVGTSPAGTGSVFSYVPANGDVVKVILTSNAACASPTTASNFVTMTVNPNEIPVVTVSASNTEVCPGTNVTFTTTTSYAGAMPTYLWRVNGVSTGVTTPTYSYVPGGNDAVEVGMTSNYSCLSRDYVLSNPVIMTVDSPIVPMITIVGSMPVEHLQSLTLTALVTNVPATELSYQWQINGDNVAGANTATLTSSNFNNNDLVCVNIFSTNECGKSAVATQCASITVNGNLSVAQTTVGSDIKVIPNPNKGAFIIKGNLGVNIDEQVTVDITNMLGQVVYSEKFDATGGSMNQNIQLNGDLANGMYLLTVHSGESNFVFHFVIEQ